MKRKIEIVTNGKKEEREIMDESIVTAIKALELMVTDEIGEAMNQYNKKVKPLE